MWLYNNTIMNGKQNRLSIISKIIESEKMRSQSQIIEKLTLAGVTITQASLSRYLKELKASRISDANGDSYYTVPKHNSTPVANLAGEIISAEFAGSMLVVKTSSGFANAVSAMIDNKKFAVIAGTVSGDDTILVVIRDGFSRRAVKKSLTKEFPYLKDKIINE